MLNLTKLNIIAIRRRFSAPKLDDILEKNGENEIDDFGKKIRKMVQQFKKFTQADAVNTASILSI